MEELRTTRRANRQAQMRVTEDELLGEGEYDDAWPSRLPTSSRRYPVVADVRAESGRRKPDALSEPGRFAQERHRVPPRRSATQTSIPAVPGNRTRFTHPEDDEGTPRTSGLLALKKGRNGRFHWLVFAGIAMFIMILGWLVFSALGSWWQTTQDDWHYGRPRTFQVDQVVGHNDSAATPSHFIAMNLNRHILIIEIPGGDPSKTRMFSGPTLLGPGQDLTPVTLTFRDVNGDGKPDMIVNIQDTHVIYLNVNGTFQPAPGQS